MLLYLVQHGQSLSEDVDPKRPLSERGCKDVTKVAQFLVQTKVPVNRIWHSTKLRAIQTAETIAHTMALGKIDESQSDLNPNDPIEPVLEKIQSANIHHLMIVGHLPFLQKLAVFLLTGSSGGEWVQFNQGGVVCLEKKDTNHWQLKWQIIPDLLP